MRAMIALALAAVAAMSAAPAANALGGTIVDCGNSTTAVTFTTLAIDPNPPVIGGNLTVSASGTASAPVRAGSLNVLVLYYGGQVFSQSISVCGVTSIQLPLGAGEAVVTGLACPVKSGDKVSVTAALPVPVVTPPGTYEIKLVGADAKGSVLCIDINADLQ